MIETKRWICITPSQPEDLGKVLGEKCHKKKIENDRYKANIWSNFPMLYSLSLELLETAEFTEVQQGAG